MHHRILLSAILAAALSASGFCADTGIPRPEYPRPQFERSEWINLNGEWSYTLDPVHIGLEKGYAGSGGFGGSIIVPFSPESKLSGVGHTDFITGIWYQRRITVPAEWTGRRVRLNFGAVYYETDVFIDGKFAGRHFGGTSSFSLDITAFVDGGGEHNLVVYAKSDLRSGLQPAGKQSLRSESYSCMYTRTTGIWQTVWMEPVAEKGLRSVRLGTDIDQKQIVFEPSFYAEGGTRLEVVVKDGGKVVGRRTCAAKSGLPVVLPLKNMKLWSPESPFLYDIEYRVLDDGGTVIDRVTSYAGMRKIHTDGKLIYLNNKPFYMRLVLDQGYYPDSQWTAPSDEALRRDIELSMAAGFNGARLHQKVFEERFHYWADRLGYLTWGESSSWGVDLNDVRAARNFILEWSEIVERDANHPSIVVWTPMNEEFWPDNVQYPRLCEDLYRLTKAIDPARPINICSGGVQPVTDIWTEHHYEQNPDKLRDILWNDGAMFSRRPETYYGRTANMGFNDTSYQGGELYSFKDYDGSIPYILDEFGGIKWVKGQDGASVNSETESWGYGKSVVSIEDFYARLEAQVNTVLSLSGHIWGYCYTQLTDVEQEQNGIYCYDRSAKFDMTRIRAIFSREPEAAAGVAPTASRAPQEIAVTAHRGFWNCEEAGYAENSIKSLELAQQYGMWGSEFDVQLTSDHVILVHHDPYIDGVRIWDHDYADFKDCRLKNGEKIPTLDEYLTQGEKNSKTVLVLELKKQIDKAHEDYMVDQSVKALKEHGLYNPARVIFLSFSLNMCERLAALCQGFTVQYLDGDKSPEELAKLGINGIGYHYTVFAENPTWFKQARDNKMSINCWTVNEEKDIQSMIDLGVDCISTNEPLLVRKKLGKREKVN